MKRLTFRHQFWLNRRARQVWEARLRRRQILLQRRQAERLKQQSPRPQIITISPPADFSFSRNYDATVQCLDRLRRAVFEPAPDGGRSRIFLDLSTIERVSVAGALVLAAEIHRWRHHHGRGLRAANIKEWHPAVRRLLAGLGFFDLLGVPVPRRMERERPRDEVTVLRMISSTELDQELLQALLENLGRIAKILDQDPSVYGALVEAAYNAKLHAYPPDREFVFPPVLKGWWATASWNPKEGVVKFLVYDQGVGIPDTLPKWAAWERIRANLAEGLGDIGLGDIGSTILKNASNLIAAAIEMDRTSLQGGHGKGLQDVIRPVTSTPGASVRILSGTGSVLYHHDGSLAKKDEKLHIGGTLIEWRIPVGVNVK